MHQDGNDEERIRRLNEIYDRAEVESEIRRSKAVKETYVKGNSTIVYFNDNRRRTKEMVSIDQAIDIAINALKDKYDLDPNGKTINVEHDTMRSTNGVLKYGIIIKINDPDGRRFHCSLDNESGEIEVFGCTIPRKERR
jgi:hypothetical protein